jgi:hypothetical protein
VFFKWVVPTMFRHPSTSKLFSSFQFMKFFTFRIIAPRLAQKAKYPSLRLRVQIIRDVPDELMVIVHHADKRVDLGGILGSRNVHNSYDFALHRMQPLAVNLMAQLSDRFFEKLTLWFVQVKVFRRRRSKTKVRRS